MEILINVFLFFFFFGAAAQLAINQICQSLNHAHTHTQTWHPPGPQAALPVIRVTAPKKAFSDLHLQAT